MTWNCLLDMIKKKGFQKRNHLRRVIPRTTKETVQMHIGENIYIFWGLLCLKSLEPRTSASSTLRETAKIMFKCISCRSILGDKEYVESVVRNRFLPVRYFLVLSDLILLNKILLCLTPLNAAGHWSITIGRAKTRSTEKLFIEARKTFRKRSEDNYFKGVARFNDSLPQLNSFANYLPQKNPCQFRREVKIFWKGKQWKDSNITVTLQNGKSSKNFNLFSPNLGTTKLVVTMFHWIH